MLTIFMPVTYHVVVAVYYQVSVHASRADGSNIKHSAIKMEKEKVMPGDTF